MTDEEVIQYLKDSYAIGNDEDSRHHNEVMEYLISALSAEGEYIKKEDALKLQYRIDDSATLSTRDVVNVDDIDELPSYSFPEREKGEWIPISERLPEIGQRVIVTYETFDEGLKVRETIYDKYGFLCGHGIAWQPLPKPYKAESEEV